jgi:hypothetical protein
MCAYHTQADVDAAFADLDAYLAQSEPADDGACVNCGSRTFERCSNPGKTVDFYSCCVGCGAVQAGVAYASEPWVVHSNYKRIHHWHERISQLLLQESRIPDDHFAQITERIRQGAYTFVNKDVIRAVLRSLGMQMYIEKWLQIVQRLTGVEPPKPGPLLTQQLDDMFLQLQTPFSMCKITGRKNFLNYNYVLCRLFQILKCPQFGMFFPLIKSKQKLKSLDEMWAAMATQLEWEITPLQTVAPFAVKLEPHVPLPAETAPPAAPAAPAATRTAPARKVFRKSDQRLLRELDRQRELKQRRSTPPAQELQRLGWSKRLQRPVWAR